MSKNVLVTGGAGFVAHHTIDYLLTNTDWNIVQPYSYGGSDKGIYTFHVEGSKGEHNTSSREDTNDRNSVEHHH